MIKRPKVAAFVTLSVLGGAGYGLIHARSSGKDAAATLREVGSGALAGTAAGLAIGFTGRGAINTYVDQKNTERLRRMPLPDEAAAEMREAISGIDNTHQAKVAAKMVAMKYLRPEIKAQQTTLEKVLLQVGARGETRKIWA